ncbi:MAG: GNAT family N-acetyltransferase [Eubacteriales bacterium]
MQISYIENEDQLKLVLDFCYDILGKHLKQVDNYKYGDWQKRIENYSRVLIFAQQDKKVIAAVLGRPESTESLVMGFTACDENYRMRGITKKLIQRFETNAKDLNFKYITLGADKNAEKFYEKCGYKSIGDIHGQQIYQKVL